MWDRRGDDLEVSVVRGVHFQFVDCEALFERETFDGPEWDGGDIWLFAGGDEVDVVLDGLGLGDELVAQGFRVHLVEGN